MLSEEQIALLVTENENLQAQLKELTMILELREEELELIKQNEGETAALRSRLELQLDEFQSMQDVIGLKQQKLEGAEERELEMERELIEAAKLQQEYDQLLQDYAHLQAQLNDITEHMLDLQRNNRNLNEIAVKVGQLESMLANISEERDALRIQISLMKNSKNHKALE